MKRFIRIISVLIIAAAALSLAACGGSPEKERPDYTARQIADEFDKHIAAVADLGEPGDDYLAAMVGVDPAAIEGYVLKLQIAGTGADSYGVFKLTDETKPNTVLDGLNKYIADLQANYSNFNYLPEEEGKIMSAQVRTDGKYVYFTILGDAERSAVNDAFEQLMKG